MADLPATNEWAIYSMQKTLPGLGIIGGIAGAHNYLALVDSNGNIVKEMHGVFNKEFSLNGGVEGNYLWVVNSYPNSYLDKQSVISSKLVFEGNQKDMQSLYRTGYESVARALNKNHELYNGAEIFGHAVNSNSVWHTALLSMGIQSTNKFDGPFSTPGNDVDLRTEATNNKWFGTSKDPWSPNPPFEMEFFSPQNKDNGRNLSSQNPHLANISSQLKKSGMNLKPPEATQNVTQKIIENLRLNIQESGGLAATEKFSSPATNRESKINREI